MDDRTKQLMAMVGSALDQANLAYSMLVDHLTPEEPELVASDDPEICQHPDRFNLETGGGSVQMCASCGVIPEL